MQNLYFQKEEYNNLEDTEIITKIKKGDTKALNYLLDKYTNSNKIFYETKTYATKFLFIIKYISI